MLEHTKKPHTENVELRFIGPLSMRDKAVKALAELGYKDLSDSIPWREVLPYSDEEMPGVLLSGARYREGLTQVQLSERTGIPRRHISEMENNKRPIGKQNARKLAQILGTDYRHFL